MISQLQNSAFTKTLWGLIGLYLLNISVDTPDPNPQHIPEDLSLNDQESIVELVVEQVLGFEDAIKEYDDYDTEEHNEKKIVKIDLLVHSSKTDDKADIHLHGKEKYFPDNEVRLTSGFIEIDSPPPRV